MGHTVEENCLSFPQPIAPQLQVGPCEVLLHPCWNIDQLDLMHLLCRQPQLLECTTLLFLEDIILKQSSSISGHWNPSSHSFLMFLSLGVWYRQPIYGQILPSHSFTAFCSVVNLCIKPTPDAQGSFLDELLLIIIIFEYSFLLESLRISHNAPQFHSFPVSCVSTLHSCRVSPKRKFKKK